MDKLEQLCQNMARDPDIMTFSDLAKAAAQGAIAGQKLNLPGGALTGAVMGVSVEATKRVVRISDRIINRPKD